MLWKFSVGEDLLSITGGWRPAKGREERRGEEEGGVEVCLPEVINLHQKSNDVKMSFQHLQLSEPVFGLFLSDAQHRAFLQTQEGK